jgi:type II secretory pathway pseudopilin PulG
VNKRQKALLTESIIIIVITAAAVVAMINLKQWVSRTEAIQVMEQLGQVVLQYRKENGSLPSGDDVKNIQEKLQEEVHLDKLQYRAQWIDVDSAPDEILAYTEKRFRASFLSDGYVVLRLDGRVDWMSKEKFQKLLGQQRRLSPQDLQILQDL